MSGTGDASRENARPGWISERRMRRVRSHGGRCLQAHDTHPAWDAAIAEAIRARVFLAGRTKAQLDKVAGEIRSNGGVADTATVDALDAIEGLRRQWACELGQHGIRVVT